MLKPAKRSIVKNIEDLHFELDEMKMAAIGQKFDDSIFTLENFRNAVCLTKPIFFRDFVLEDNKLNTMIIMSLSVEIFANENKEKWHVSMIQMKEKSFERIVASDYKASPFEFNQNDFGFVQKELVNCILKYLFGERNDYQERISGTLTHYFLDKGEISDDNGMNIDIQLPGESCLSN